MSAGLLQASVAERVLTYLLLPWGESGRTSLGRVTAAEGSVEVPSDPRDVVLNLEHEKRRPVGRGLRVWSEARGLLAAFHIARTSAGDDLLEEAAEGLRTGVSVEVDDPVIRRGELLGGLLSGAGAVVEPAFPSALLVASDCGDLDLVDVTPRADAFEGWLARNTVGRGSRQTASAHPWHDLDWRY